MGTLKLLTRVMGRAAFVVVCVAVLLGLSAAASLRTNAQSTARWPGENFISGHLDRASKAIADTRIGKAVSELKKEHAAGECGRLCGDISTRLVIQDGHMLAHDGQDAGAAWTLCKPDKGSFMQSVQNIQGGNNDWAAFWDFATNGQAQPPFTGKEMNLSYQCKDKSKPIEQAGWEYCYKQTQHACKQKCLSHAGAFFENQIRRPSEGLFSIDNLARMCLCKENFLNTARTAMTEGADPTLWANNPQCKEAEDMDETLDRSWDFYATSTCRQAKAEIKAKIAEYRADPDSCPAAAPAAVKEDACAKLCSDFITKDKDDAAITEIANLSSNDFAARFGAPAAVSAMWGSVDDCDTAAGDKAEKDLEECHNAVIAASGV